MSLQWSIVAAVLYVEIALVFLLLLPFIPAKRWQRFFKSKFFNALERQANMYFNIFIGLLVLLFLDAIREVSRYQSNMDLKKDGDVHLDAEMQAHMKLFRAQRNFYISGFALFLWMVLRRLVILITTQAQLEANSEASIKQAQGANEMAQKLMARAQGGESADNIGNDARETLEKQVVELQQNWDQEKQRIKSMEIECEKAKSDVQSMRKQAESLTREYDRLLGENEILQRQNNQLKGVQGDKKGE